jgi:Tfp pilus assembly protein PilF
MKNRLFLVLAAALFLSACATGPTKVQESLSHYKNGLNRMESGNDESALYEFNMATAENPRNRDAHFAAGIVYYK